MLVRMAHKPRALVQKQYVFILIHHFHFIAEAVQQLILLFGFTEKLVLDIKRQHIALVQPVVGMRALSVSLDALKTQKLLQKSVIHLRKVGFYPSVQPAPLILF